jgi:hypothetical protein
MIEEFWFTKMKRLLLKASTAKKGNLSPFIEKENPKIKVKKKKLTDLSFPLLCSLIFLLN